MDKKKEMPKGKMTAGAGSAKGREQKADMQKKPKK